MKGTYYTGIAGVWFVFWLIRLIFGIIDNRNYYLNTDSGRLELMFYALMALLGLVVFLYLFLKKNGNRLAYRVSKEDRCPECYTKLHGSEFCPKCGSELKKKSPDRTCWNCGYVEHDPGVTSCPKCGREFKKE